MNTTDFASFTDFSVLVAGENKTIETIYCSDLLSWAMGNLPADGAWCTVIGNINAIAVAHLADAAVIVLCEGALLDEDAKQKAEEQNITVVSTSLPAFQAGLRIMQQGNISV